MIYADKLGDAAGQHWVPLGRLVMDHDAPRMQALGTGYRPFFIGGFAVTFYATRPEFVPELRTAVQGWAPTLPEGARFLPAEWP
jgi:hypothetical protein